ncbi:hypothetical protein [Streptomyces chartreusis]
MSHEFPAEPRFYELSDLLEAYAYTGFTFTDTAGTPGPGLASYLRIAARDPARAATAVQQIDELLSVGLFSEEIADDVESQLDTATTALGLDLLPPQGTSLRQWLELIRRRINVA